MNHPKENHLDPLRVLAMIHAMIEESIYHTETFSHTLNVHHNDKAAKVFRLICEQFKKEQIIVLNGTLNVDLPTLPPWEVPYTEYIHPSSVLIHANYLMTESEAWGLMFEMIEIHKRFYTFLCKENSENTLFSVVDLLVNYCNDCGEKNKRLEAKAETKWSKSGEDIDIISLHSNEGGLW